MRAFAGLFTDDSKDYKNGDHHWGPFLDFKIQSAGTKCWSGHEFFEKGPVVHVLNLTVKSEWRGCGIGSRVYASLQSTLQALRGTKYMFVRLGALVPPPAGASTNSQAFKDWVENGRRVRAFHRRVRGYSELFRCLGWLIEMH